MPRWRRRTASVFPPQAILADGHDPLTVVSRFGRLTLSRQVLYHVETQTHTLPGNRVLPAHHGLIITRGLQEWACLLSQDLPFEAVTRLLGWQTQDDAVLSATTVRMLVQHHGQTLRAAEAAEVADLLSRPDLAALTPQLVDAGQVCHRAGWPADLNAAVDAALAAQTPTPPVGVSTVDWERVLAARRAEATLDATALRHLGPKVAADQVVVSADEVLTRQPAKRRFWELRTARVATATGYRYLSGTGESFLQQLGVLILLCVGAQRALLFIVDGARWLRTFYASLQAHLPRAEMILDWYHLHHKCYELSSMICRGRTAKAQLLHPLYRHLWHGEVQLALTILADYRPQAKNEDKLDELIAYLTARRECMPNYSQRRQACTYIGSGPGEKANDLIVARRQKKQGMHWSLPTTDALAALRTLTLNRGWQLYWSQRRVLPLVAT